MNRHAICFALGTCGVVCGSQAAAADCKQGILDGGRILVNDCAGICGVYEVDDSRNTDLGFGDTLPDMISFEFYSPDPADSSYPQTGTFDLASAVNANYATCQQCIVVYQDYADPDTPTKTFFQTAGSITIDSHTIPGVTPAIGLSWDNVAIAEVTIDPDTFVSTLVPGGDCYTIVPDVIFANGFN